MTGAGFWTLSLGSLVGAGVGAASARLAGVLCGGDRSHRGAERQRLRETAVFVGAIVPAFGWALIPEPRAAVAIAVVAWLMLAIAICDERSLSIPHPLWFAGLLAGFGLAWQAAGWAGVAARGISVITLEVTFVVVAGAVWLWRGRSPVGSADFGVVAFVGAALGPVAADALLVASVVALGCFVFESTSPRSTRTSAFVASSVALACLGGTGGAILGALLLSVSIARDSRRGRVHPPAPFGACLVAAAITVVLVSSVLPRLALPGLRQDVVLHRLFAEQP